jgi:hypothetical protein
VPASGGGPLRTWDVADPPIGRTLAVVRAGRRPATEEITMVTLHIENQVHDYDTWKTVFDKFDRERRSRGMRSYRIVRAADDPSRVLVDMEFDSTTRAEEFREFLRAVRATPQSQAQLVDQRPPAIFEVAEEKTFA